MDAAILVVRLIIGLALAAHGAQKLFGWFGGYGLRGTGGFFENLGFKPGPMFALLAGLGEFGGGVLTALGLLNPVGPALIILVMLVAIITVHLPHGFFAASNGVELPLMNSAGALAIAFVGPGAYSVDSVVGFTALSAPSTVWVVVAVAVVLALLNVAIRRPVAQQQAPQT